jgi:hypothetical protein
MKESNLLIDICALLCMGSGLILMIIFLEEKSFFDFILYMFGGATALLGLITLFREERSIK